jgi:hypothetical protein
MNAEINQQVEEHTSKVPARTYMLARGSQEANPRGVILPEELRVGQDKRGPISNVEIFGWCLGSNQREDRDMFYDKRHTTETLYYISPDYWVVHVHEVTKKEYHPTSFATPTPKGTLYESKRLVTNDGQPYIGHISNLEEWEVRYLTEEQLLREYRYLVIKCFPGLSNDVFPKIEAQIPVSHEAPMKAFTKNQKTAFIIAAIVFGCIWLLMICFSLIILLSSLSGQGIVST